MIYDENLKIEKWLLNNISNVINELNKNIQNNNSKIVYFCIWNSNYINKIKNSKEKKEYYQFRIYDDYLKKLYFDKNIILTQNGIIQFKFQNELALNSQSYINWYKLYSINSEIKNNEINEQIFKIAYPNIMLLILENNLINIKNISSKNQNIKEYIDNIIEWFLKDKKIDKEYIKYFYNNNKIICQEFEFEYENEYEHVFNFQDTNNHNLKINTEQRINNLFELIDNNIFYEQLNKNVSYLKNNNTFDYNYSKITYNMFCLYWKNNLLQYYIFIWDIFCFNYNIKRNFNINDILKNLKNQQYYFAFAEIINKKQINKEQEYHIRIFTHDEYSIYLKYINNLNSKFIILTENYNIIEQSTTIDIEFISKFNLLLVIINQIQLNDKYQNDDKINIDKINFILHDIDMYNNVIVKSIISSMINNDDIINKIFIQYIWNNKLNVKLNIINFINNLNLKQQIYGGFKKMKKYRIIYTN